MNLMSYTHSGTQGLSGRGLTRRSKTDLLNLQLTSYLSPRMSGEGGGGGGAVGLRSYRGCLTSCSKMSLTWDTPSDALDDTPSGALDCLGTGSPRDLRTH